MITFFVGLKNATINKTKKEKTLAMWAILKPEIIRDIRIKNENMEALETKAQTQSVRKDW